MSLTIEERQLIELRIRNDAPSVVVAYVMWGFLGLISAHRFYLGRPRSAVLQILSWLTVICGLIWWLYDAVMISAYIRDDKNALRAKLIEELESEKRGGGSISRPRAVETPVDRAPAPTPAPAKPAPPMAAAASMPTKPGKPAADSDLVLVSRAGQPLVLDDPRPTPIEAAAPSPPPAPAAPPKVAIKLDDRAEAQAAATLAFSEPETEPAPELKAAASAPPVPHPEAVDDSPIEVFPPKPTLADPPPGTPVAAPQLEPAALQSPAPKADEWVMGEPLRLDRNP